MRDDHPQASPGLYFFLLFNPVFSYGLLYFPLTAARTVGPDGYLAFPPAVIMILPLIFLNRYFQGRYAGRTVLEYSPLILGRFFGPVFNLLYLIFIFLISAVTIREAAALARNFLLLHTPLWTILLLQVIFIIYLSYYGLSPVGRLAAFLVPFGLLIFLMVLFGFQHWEVLNILPAGKQPLKTYLTGGWAILSIFYPLILIFQTSAFITQKEKAFPLSLLALGLMAAPYFLTLLGVFGVFSAEGVTRYFWPTLEYTRTISISFLLLKQVGLLLLIAWYLLFYSSGTIFFFLLAHGIAQVWNAFPHPLRRNLSFRSVLLCLGPVYFGILLSIKNLETLRDLLTRFQPAGTIFLLGAPLLLWIVSLFRRTPAKD